MTPPPHHDTPDEDGAHGSPHRARLFGYAVIVLTFGGLGGWAATARIDSATVAPGVVTLEGSRKVVQHLEGGIVSRIHVREADAVRAGQILVSLERVEARSDVARLSQRLHDARAVEARLLAERARAARLTPPAELTAAARTDPRLARTLRTQQALLDDRLAIHATHTEILNFRLEQLDSQRAGLERQRAALERRIDLHTDLIARLDRGNARGVVGSNALSERQDALIRIEATLGEVMAEQARVGVAISETRLTLLQLRQEFQERTHVGLEDIRTRIAEIGEHLTVARDTLARTDIRAPSDGVVQAIKVTTEGSVIRPGEVLMEIVPQDDSLLISARVAPVDIDNVRPGQRSEVRLVAFNARLTPVVLGRLESVSRDVIAPAAPDQEPYYLARVRVAPETLSEDMRTGLTPGMPADVVIVNGERRVLDYLISPLGDAIARAFRER